MAAVERADRRAEREAQTVRAMLRLFCQAHHHAPIAPEPEGLCPECAELYRFAQGKIARCPFGADKPTCDTCTVHCYPRAKRERIREVMRYAGPRMIWRHPAMALWHLIERRRSLGRQRAC